jgi:hydrogenase maturation protease
VSGGRIRVIGIGQPSAGDDGAGIAVARALREHRVPAGVEIHEITDTTRLVELLEGIPRAILIDAVVADRAPGNLLCLTPEELVTQRVTPLSSHGAGVAEAIRLARTLAPATVAATISLIGLTIAPPMHCTRHLSPAVSAALPRAVTLVRRLLDG